jgi:thioredoxin-related protein
VIIERRRLLSALILLLTMSAALYVKNYIAPAGQPPSARTGSPLPPLMADEAGTSVDLRTIIRGRKSVIIFFSPSCRICQEMLPFLQPFPDAFKLVLVSESNDAKTEAERLFPQARLFYDRSSMLLRVFGNLGLPTIVFVDANGILRDGLVGMHTRESVRSKLKQFETGP